MADIALILLTLSWGTSFSLVKKALSSSSPALFLTMRFFVATLTAGAVVMARRERISRALLRDGTILGALTFAMFALQTEGLKYTTPARSGFLTGLCVIVVPFLERFVWKKPVPPAAWVGALLALVGTGVLSQPFGGAVSAKVRLGDALTLGCAIASGLLIVVVAERSARHPLAALALVQIAVTLVGGAICWGLEPSQVTVSPSFVAIVLVTGTFLTVGATYVQNWGQRHTTAVRAAVIFALEPVFAALFSALWLKERLGTPMLAGGALIVGGVLVATTWTRGEGGGAPSASPGSASPPR